ncbi:MAG: hypothetical protein ACI8RZ_007774 [Myxococcota bacterium]|jgi:hypothetical protein
MRPTELSVRARLGLHYATCDSPTDDERSGIFADVESRVGGDPMGCEVIQGVCARCVGRGVRRDIGAQAASALAEAATTRLEPIRLNFSPTRLSASRIWGDRRAALVGTVDFRDVAPILQPDGVRVARTAPGTMGELRILDAVGGVQERFPVISGDVLHVVPGEQVSAGTLLMRCESCETLIAHLPGATRLKVRLHGVREDHVRWARCVASPCCSSSPTSSQGSRGRCWF